MAGYPVSWTRVTSLTVLLMPISWLYGVVMAMRRALYAVGVLRSEGLPVPVIVIGNISVGGTGKTPLVLWLVARLRSAGYAPGIVSRGYLASGASANEPRAVNHKDDAALCGDEPVLLARRGGCPVWIGADRVAAARALLAAHPECNVIVSDDGLQHYRLARDAEIAVIDGARGHGNGLLLPAGPLREPRARLNRVNAVVIRGDGKAPAATDIATMTNAPQFTMSMEPGQFYNLHDPQQTREVLHFHKQRVHAAAGIGNPEHFFNTLTSLGLAFTPHSFPDHHPYTQADLAFTHCDAVVMTEKDAVKYERYAAEATEKCWALGIAARVEPRLASMLIELVRQRLTKMQSTS
ncbi:MAG: tetraacyldisaccharide 4'-kinase [Burkholderiales bacterium]